MYLLITLLFFGRNYKLINYSLICLSSSCNKLVTAEKATHHDATKNQGLAPINQSKNFQHYSLSNQASLMSPQPSEAFKVETQLQLLCFLKVKVEHPHIKSSTIRKGNNLNMKKSKEKRILPKGFINTPLEITLSSARRNTNPPKELIRR